MPSRDYLYLGIRHDLDRPLADPGTTEDVPISPNKETWLLHPPQLFLVKVNIRDCAAQSQATLHEAQPCRGVVGELLVSSDHLEELFR
jgi:hypothetical protein